MIYEFKLPDIGEGLVEGEVVRWLVEEGDLLQEDQPMVEVMTDKATVEISSPRRGRVARRLYAEGQNCPVGKVLIEIEIDNMGPSEGPAPPAKGPAGQSPSVPTRNNTGPSEGPAPPAKGPAGQSPSVPTRSEAPPGKAAAGGSGAGALETSVLATPATRKLARDAGVDIGTVAGTGPAGRVTSRDVEAHGAGGASRSPGDVRIPFRGLRKKIAENMVRSKHTAAHFTYVEEIDCSELVLLRARVNQRLAAEGGKLSFLPFIVRATVAALEKFPQLNAMLDEAAGEIVQHKQIHIGLATATEGGLLVPVVRNANALTVLELAQEIDRLAAVTRTGKAAREDLSGSTFTITSLGALGGVLAAPIINYPEVAILGVHKISRRPAVIGDKIEIRDLMNLSISVDHRVVDGYDAARFVAEIKAMLEAPDRLGVA
jgi:pyruvate dehydrogenase E2 component (dihydrolipoamide acetyltransferase)